MSSIPPRDAPSASFASPRFLAKLTTGAFVVFAVGCLWEISLSLEALSAIADPAGFDVGWAESFDARLVQASYGSLGFYLLNALFFGIWTHRVAKNARCFDWQQLSVSPGWAVGYYFVPIVSLWRPYQALAEVWRASSPDERKHVPGWFTAWWWAWIVSIFFERFVAVAETSTLEEWASLHRRIIAADVFSLVAASLAMLVVWRLTRLQDRRWADGNPARATVEKG